MEKVAGTILGVPLLVLKRFARYIPDLETLDLDLDLDIDHPGQLDTGHNVTKLNKKLSIHLLFKNKNKNLNSCIVQQCPILKNCVFF